MNVDKLYEKNTIKVLKYLFMSEKDNSLNNIIEGSGLSKVTVLGIINLLIELNIVLSKEIGNTKFYSVVKNEPYFMLKKSYYLMVFSNLVMDLRDCEIYLFGSFAKGVCDKNSDIDLLVISENKDIILSIDKRFKDINHPLNIIHKTPLEYSLLSKKNPVFFKEIRNTKVRLL